ncbi:hypothetical protein Egran_00193 [Elaphomyces granulatus]|uniref:Arf-GAP domain-containing protein n=1 Tax=Elaphomyces granulatus TaxID=519963 RepID=A0A232M6N7_9EURO|nr:hypothetical protein Egran_00193 [Elaphomyces granulatus]
MVSLPSKRQQARNEKALQDLIKAVPGNDRCADCDARNPGWASWNLGVFLCLRCATLHRKIGTHISKVKSLSMDSWTSDQVETMKKNGNAAVNKFYNPRNVRPPVPIDVDEVDSAMERFIRQKYEHQTLEDGKPKPPSRDDSGYQTNRSLEDSPPPLPPKSSRKFGFTLRSVSSASRLSPSSDRQSNPPSVSPRSDTFDFLSSPIPINKPSQIFGASIGETSASFESKLAVLRDMGFPDDKRNATILKGLSGNLEKTVESLVRLGEGSNPGSRSRTPAPKTTPTSGHFPSSLSSPRSTVSTNPFDQLDVVATTNEAQKQVKSYNPFDVPISQTASTSLLEASFQNLQVSPPLFPHSTGGYPSQQGQVPQPPYQQSMTPPVILTPSQRTFGASLHPPNGTHNPFFQPTVAAPSGGVDGTSNLTLNITSTNPFFSQISPQVASTQSSSPLQFSPSATGFEFQKQIGLSANTAPFSFQPLQPPPQQQFPPQLSYRPFGSMTASPNQIGSPHQYPVQPRLSTTQSISQSQPQHLTPQITGRVDKNSILALYKLSPPSAVPEHPLQQAPPVSGHFQLPSNSSHTASVPLPAPGSTPQAQSFNQSAPRRSVTMPEDFGTAPTGTRNPFLSPPASSARPAVQSTAPFSTTSSELRIGLAAKAAPPGLIPRVHMSQASVDISGLQNGRHSPDAFVSLSARYV